MANKKVIIRVDGNTNIGLGHVYRGIALAEMLKEESVKFGNKIEHPTLGTMYQYDGKYSRNPIKVTYA